MNTASRTTVLVDQTMLCEAARLLAGRPAGGPSLERPGASGLGLFLEGAVPTNAERLLHLSMLLDALLLFDRVLVLQGEVPPDTDSLEFYCRLIEGGAVELADPAPFADEVAMELRDFLEATEMYGRLHAGASTRRLGLSRSLAELVREYLRPSPGPTSSDYSHDPRLLETLHGQVEGHDDLYSFSPEHQTMYRLDLADNALATVGANVSGNLHVAITGDPLVGVSHLRTLIYWRVSERLEVPFLPSCRRLPPLDLIHSQLWRSVPIEIGRCVSEAFGATVDEVFEDVRPKPVLAPPFLALFLSEMRLVRDPWKCLEGLRQEFAPLRAAIRELDAKLRNAGSIKERLEAKAHAKLVLDSLGGHHEGRESFSLAEVLGYAPDVIKPLSDPLDPESYDLGLLTKSAKWVRAWWTRRPFRIAYQIRDRLHAIESYGSLISDSIGVDVDAREARRFASYYDEFLSLYSSESGREKT